MTLQQLQYLMEVYRVGSIAGAAKNLYTAQPSVSKSIKAIEQEFGVELFSRKWDGVVPTEEGARLIEQASQICEIYEQMHRKNNTAPRMVRIGGTSYEPVCAAFSRLSAELLPQRKYSLSLSDQPQQQLLEKMSSFGVDVGVLLIRNQWMRVLDSKLKARELERRVLATLPAVIRIGAGHPLYEQEQIQPEDLANDVLIGTEATMDSFSSHMRDRLNVNPDCNVIVKDKHTRYQMVAQGIGYSVSPPLPAKLAEQYGFRQIPMDGVFYRLVLVTNPLQRQTPPVQRYIELLKEELLPMAVTGETAD